MKLDLNPKVQSLTEKRSIIDIQNRYFANKFRKRRNHVILTSDSENSAKNALWDFHMNRACNKGV